MTVAVHLFDVPSDAQGRQAAVYRFEPALRISGRPVRHALVSRVRPDGVGPALTGAFAADADGEVLSWDDLLDEAADLSHAQALNRLGASLVPGRDRGRCTLEVQAGRLFWGVLRDRARRLAFEGRDLRLLESRGLLSRSFRFRGEPAAIADIARTCRRIDAACAD